MLMIGIILYLTLIFNFLSCVPIDVDSTVTFDESINNTITTTTFSIQTSSYHTNPKLKILEFLNYTTFPYLSFSPTSQYLLFQTKRPAWTKSSYVNSLWLYNVETKETILITEDLYAWIKPQWSPSGSYIALFLNNDTKHAIYLYSIDSHEFSSIRIDERQTPKTFTWSHNDSSIYFVDDESNENFILENIGSSKQGQYTKMNTIYRMDIHRINHTISTEIHFIKNIPYSISEFLFIPFEEKLIFTNTSSVLDELHDSEIYSLDLKNLSSLIRLTNNTISEDQLLLSTDHQTVLFSALVLSEQPINETHQGLYTLNLTSGEITYIGKQFDGDIKNYAPKSNGGMYILGQWKTNVEVYSQQLPNDNWIFHRGFPGTYHSIASSSNPNCLIAFVHSCSEWPMEIFCTNDTNDLRLAERITRENNLFTQRNLPKTEIYRWTNVDDQRVIEGILHYPPEKFQSKNLSLLVLIHGGLADASLNQLNGNYYDWAPLAASYGWLVLEPNYRGSTGYGPEFATEALGNPLSLPEKDILSGVDQLINDGIANPSKLAVGGCSYGGFLTNWLITQTERFNAALSYAGGVEYASLWGETDGPGFYTYWFNGFPWQVPHIYQKEAPIYQLNKVRTPTYICTGEQDRRVPASQSYILKRGLDSLGVPAKLRTFPNEGHSLDNPWYGLIKVSEELKWLKKYGEGEN